jgi:hypothetical protein
MILPGRRRGESGGQHQIRRGGEFARRESEGVEGRSHLNVLSPGCGRVTVGFNVGLGGPIRHRIKGGEFDRVDVSRCGLKFSGEGGIRTPDTVFTV